MSRELGDPARSTYVNLNQCLDMPSSNLEAGGGIEAATETVQTMLFDFGEPIIGDKTHAEILAMNWNQRHRWYKKISSEEKIEAMRIVDISLRAKRSVITKKRWENPEFRAKFSGENSPTKRPEVRAKMSENHHMKRLEFRAKFSQLAKKWWEDPEYRTKRSGENNPAKRPEVRAKISEKTKRQWKDPEYRTKMSAMMSGENGPNWKGGVSFEPYCHKFNDQLKERIRNRDNRTCILCGKSEILNGRRLAVHHIDNSKTQGCNGEKWYLCALCHSCNSKSDTVEKEFLIVSNLSPVRRRSGL